MVTGYLSVLSKKPSPTAVLLNHRELICTNNQVPNSLTEHLEGFQIMHIVPCLTLGADRSVAQLEAVVPSTSALSGWSKVSHTAVQ